jgi:hypothetical protein
LKKKIEIFIQHRRLETLFNSASVLNLDYNYLKEVKIKVFIFVNLKTLFAIKDYFLCMEMRIEKNFWRKCIFSKEEEDKE